MDEKPEFEPEDVLSQSNYFDPDEIPMAEAYGGVIDSATFNEQLEVTAAYVVESYINMLANNDVLSILRLFSADPRGILSPGIHGEIGDFYDQTYEQHDAAIEAYGDDAWENVTYTLEHEEHTGGR